MITAEDGTPTPGPRRLIPRIAAGSLIPLMLLGIVVGVSVNVLQFPAIEAETRHNYRALYGYWTSDVFEIAISSDTSARQRVAPFYYLGVLFPHSRVITPTTGVNSWFSFDESILGLGRASTLLRVDYDPATIVELGDLTDYRVHARSFAPSEQSARAIDERVAYYALDRGPWTFVTVTPDGAPGRTGFFAFVDVRLLSDETRADLGAQ